jgi:uncharacterized RDD family membrane protein YckC
MPLKANITPPKLAGTSQVPLPTPRPTPVATGVKYPIVRHHHIPPDYSHCPPAPFTARIIALAIDGVICTVISKLASLIIFSSTPLAAYKLYLDPFVQSIALVTYFTIAQSHWGFTVGKRVMHLKVIDARTGGIASRTRIFYRETVGRNIVFFTLGIGYLVAAFGNKLAWHDRLAKTHVVLDQDDTDTAL